MHKKQALNLYRLGALLIAGLALTAQAIAMPIMGPINALGSGLPLLGTGTVSPQQAFVKPKLLVLGFYRDKDLDSKLRDTVLNWLLEEKRFVVFQPVLSDNQKGLRCLESACMESLAKPYSADLIVGGGIFKTSKNSTLIDAYVFVVNPSSEAERRDVQKRQYREKASCSNCDETKKLESLNSAVRKLVNDRYPVGSRDLCLNIPGLQAVLPPGMLQDANDRCFQDECPNLPGLQVSVPEDMLKDGPNCVRDECPNVPGLQVSVPSGMLKDGPNCFRDECPNLPGLQASIPSGMFKDGPNCIRDECPNLPGLQASIPPDMLKDRANNCVRDECPNLPGLQVSLPAGLFKESGQCLPDECANLPGVQVAPPPGMFKVGQNCVADVCLNLDGGQATVPERFTSDGNGNCTLLALRDECPNLEGNQEKIPPNMRKNNFGQCVPAEDQCPNIDDIQPSVPAGLVKDEMGNCVALTDDVCPNLEGLQTTVPEGFTKDPGGLCVKLQEDLCPNLDGIQSVIPADREKDSSGNCVPVPKKHSVSCAPVEFNRGLLAGGGLGLMAAGSVGALELHYLAKRPLELWNADNTELIATYDQTETDWHKWAGIGWGAAGVGLTMGLFAAIPQLWKRGAGSDSLCGQSEKDVRARHGPGDLLGSLGEQPACRLVPDAEE